MLKETFSMRKIGKHLVNVSMLGLAVAPIAGSALAPVTVLAAEQTDRKVEKIPFKTETKDDPTLPKGEKKVIQKGVEGEKEYVTSTPSASQSTRKPVDVIVPYDVSGSTSGGEAELDHLEAVAKQGADDTRYLIIGYDEGNSEEGFMTATTDKTQGGGSYRKGAKLSKITKMLSKQQILDFVAKVRELKPQSQQDGSWPWDNAMKALDLYDSNYMKSDGNTKEDGLPYEVLFDKLRDKNKEVGILWFTDEWEPTETLDKSFFEWAQSKYADHFLTVVYGGEKAKSYKTLKAAGQKEILTTEGKDKTALAKEIADKFTKLVTITVPGKPTTSEKVIKEPVNEIIAVGTKEAEATKRTEEIPFKTETKEDPTLPEGEQKVVQKGEKGLREFTTTQDTIAEFAAEVGFNIKAGTSTSKQVSRKSVDLLAIIDTSNSMVENYGRALASAENLVKSMTDDDQITFAHYQTNGLDSYNTGNGKADGNAARSKPMLLGAMTMPMKKAEAIKYLNDAKNFKVGSNGVDFGRFVDAQETLGYKFQKEDGKGFQDVYMAHHKKDSTISVIQFTDGWMSSESIDTDFATWATKNAKTFMTVSFKNNVGGNGGPTEFSIVNMKKAGHSNIYDERVTAIDDAAIIKQFESTATEKVTVTKQDVNIDLTLTIPKDSKLEYAEFKTPNGLVELTVKDNVATYSGKKVVDGDYSLTYKIKGGNGDAKVVVLKDGKELISKSDKVVSTKGSTSDKVIKEPINEIIHIGTKGSKSDVTEKKIPFETIYKQDATLKKGEEKVLQEGVEGLIKVTTIYETQKGQKVDGSEKVTEETVTEKVDKIIAQGTMEKRKVRYRVVDSKGQELVKQMDVMEAYQDEEYKVETPKLDGYRLELAKDSVPATGKVADRDVLVTFVAVKIGKPVTLKFVDEAGTEIAQKKVLTGENVDVDTEFKGEAPATIEKDGIKYVFVGIKQTGSKERKVSGKVTDKEQVIEAVYSKPKELPKTNEQAKQRHTVIVALLSVVGLGGLVTYFGLRKRDEK